MILATFACALFAACGSSTSSNADAATARDATNMVASICGKPGDPGNAIGVVSSKLAVGNLSVSIAWVWM